MIDEELAKVRMKICEECPLFLKQFGGPVCNPNKWLDLTDKTTVINYPKAGYVRGCNCFLERKTKLVNAKCVAEKW